MNKKRKTRADKAQLYEEKYSEIPKQYEERLNWMIDKYKLSESKMDSIINKRDMMLQSLYYNDLLVILYEEPEPTPRPRFRLVNRYNLANEAMNNSKFVHVYSINAHEDNVFMKRMVENELNQLSNLIYTPCNVEYDIFQKTPSAFNIEDIFLAEMGLIRPINQKDWDNFGKKYSDMYNSNVWLDDGLVISGTVNKLYSILPRVEIRLKYLNCLYNKYQYNSIKKRLPNQVITYVK